MQIMREEAIETATNTPCAFGSSFTDWTLQPTVKTSMKVPMNSHSSLQPALVHVSKQAPSINTLR